MDRLQSEITELLSDEGVILLEFNSVRRNGVLILRIIADRETSGITIDDCAKLAREIRNLILEKVLTDSDFTMEVSSPGLDYPLKHDWQFRKNIGRLLKLQIPGEKGPKEISGRLMAVGENEIQLDIGKKTMAAGYSDILSAKVLPEFKSPRTES